MTDSFEGGHFSVFWRYIESASGNAKIKQFQLPKPPAAKFVRAFKCQSGAVKRAEVRVFIGAR